MADLFSMEKDFSLDNFNEILDSFHDTFFFSDLNIPTYSNMTLTTSQNILQNTAMPYQNATTPMPYQNTQNMLQNGMPNATQSMLPNATQNMLPNAMHNMLPNAMQNTFANPLQMNGFFDGHAFTRRNSLPLSPLDTAPLASTHKRSTSESINTNLVFKKQKSDLLTPLPEQFSEGARQKSFPCPYAGCNKVFPRQYNLKSHMFCHSGLRPHQCHLCTSAFARKHDLQRHLHAEVGMYSCGECGERFTCSEMKKRHEEARHG